MKSKDKIIIIYTHRAWPITDKICAPNSAHSVAYVLITVLAFFFFLWVGSFTVGSSNRHTHTHTSWIAAVTSNILFSRALKGFFFFFSWVRMENVPCVWVLSDAGLVNAALVFNKSRRIIKQQMWNDTRPLMILSWVAWYLRRWTDLYWPLITCPDPHTCPSSCIS